MLISEFGNRLDMQCIVSFTLDSEFGNVSRKYKLKSVAKVRRIGKKALMLVNTSHNEALPMDFSREMERLGAINYAGAWSMAIDVTDSFFMPFFTELIEIPSVVIDAVLIENDRCMFYFRFHENNRLNVGNTVMKNSSVLKGLSIPFFGKASDRVESIHQLSAEIPLHYVEIATKVPPQSLDIQKDRVITTFGNHWLREIKYLYDGNTHSVYYELDKLLSAGPDTVEISAKEKTYETTFQNPLIDYFFTQCTESYIALLGMGQKLSGRDFFFYTVIPSMNLERFTGIMFQSFSRFSTWNMSLIEVMPGLRL